VLVNASLTSQVQTDQQVVRWLRQHSIGRLSIDFDQICRNLRSIQRGQDVGPHHRTPVVFVCRNYHQDYPAGDIIDRFPVSAAKP